MHEGHKKSNKNSTKFTVNSSSSSLVRFGRLVVSKKKYISHADGRMKYFYMHNIGNGTDIDRPKLLLLARCTLYNFFVCIFVLFVQGSELLVWNIKSVTKCKKVLNNINWPKFVTAFQNCDILRWTKSVKVKQRTSYYCPHYSI